MTRQATCEERISEHMSGRLGDLRLLARTIENEAPATDAERQALDDLGALVDEDATDYAQQERAQDVAYELPLSIEIVRSVRIVFSTGGPHDEVTVELDEDYRAIRGEYRFSDWFDTATRPLDEDDLLTIETLYGSWWESVLR